MENIYFINITIFLYYQKYMRDNKKNHTFTGKENPLYKIH